MTVYLTLVAAYLAVQILGFIFWLSLAVTLLLAAYVIVLVRMLKGEGVKHG